VGLAGEGDEPLETAVGTAHSGEAAGQDAAVEVAPEFALDEGGEPSAAGAPVPGGGEEGLEPVADDLVEECLLGLAPAVRTDRGAGRAGMALPRLVQESDRRERPVIWRPCTVARGRMWAGLPSSARYGSSP